MTQFKSEKCTGKIYFKAGTHLDVDVNLGQ